MQGSFNSTGLVVSSKMPRFSDLYTLTIASADPKSKAAKDPVEFTKSVTQWSLSLSPSPIHSTAVLHIIASAILLAGKLLHSLC